jgi:AcrR family transcriptional regulator
MRVTPQTRKETRARLLEAGRRLFGAEGFAATTTRRIAEEAGVGAGTLFNYFPTKEALGLAILGQAARAAEDESARGPGSARSLEEELFHLLAVLLRHWEPYRAWVPEALEGSLSPLRAAAADADSADDLRRRYLERVEALLAEAGRRPDDALLVEHVHWALTLGVIGFWARDASEHQSATLALLDRTTRLFCQALRGEPAVQTGG